MRVIIAGSRYKAVSEAEMNQIVRRSGFHITEVVSGCCRGIDVSGMKWADMKGFPVKKFPAEWEAHGKKAGPIRNCQMAEYAEALIAIPGVGPGTWGMIRIMQELKKPVFIWDSTLGKEINGEHDVCHQLLF